MNIIEFPSISEHLDAAEGPARTLYQRAFVSEPEKRAAALARQAETFVKARFGDPALLENVNDIIGEVESQSATDYRTTLTHFVTGPIVNPGRYAMGHPLSCIRRMPEIQSFRQVKMIVNITCSAGVNDRHLARRAACIIGLMTRLQAEGVDLDLYLLEEGAAPAEGIAARARGKSWERYVRNSDSSGDYAHLVRIESRPLNMAQAAYVMTQGAMFRDAVLPALCQEFVGYHAASWPTTLDALKRIHGYDEGKRIWLGRQREALGMAPHDLYFGAYHFDEIGEDMHTWIAKYARQALDTRAAA